MRFAFFIALSVCVLTGLLIWLWPSSPEPEKPRVYADVSSCVADGNNADKCAEAFKGARNSHDLNAPHYPTASSCEQTYGVGQCVPRGSNNDSFGPLMAGFMFGHMIGSLSGPAYAPVYIDRERRHYYGGGGAGTVTYISPGSSVAVRSSTYGGSTTTVISGARGPSVSPAMAPSVSARGGFGASAASVATSGGS